VIEFNKEILKDFAKNQMEGPNVYPKWDKAKHLICNHAIKAWEDKVRARGSNLKRLQKKHDRLARDLHMLPLTWSWRKVMVDSLETCTRALHIATAKDMAACKEATEAKWIQMAGKPNKDFLAKPRGAHKRFKSITIDNVKDQPDLLRTDDIKIILQNFIDYYAKLYEHKEICPIALNKLTGNLTLSLDKEES
jgi:hypothetical protein